MSLPLYVPPEQLIKDRADFARKGVRRGRPAVVISYDQGILLAGHNPSRALAKIGEIHDRIGFAGVGKYNEFEILRVAGIRYADLRGYAYDRSDVNARALAGAYAQTLAAAFTNEAKPFEVEVAVAEVGAEASEDQVFQVLFDGSVSDEYPWAVLGGAENQAREALANDWQPGLSLRDAASLAVRVIGTQVPLVQLESAVLRRAASGRSFERLDSALWQVVGLK